MTFEIAVPLRGKFEGRTWRMTEPFLKLALKYGMIGPWQHRPWAYFNRSVAFDAYSVTRGPDKGLPDLGDFCSTLMMGSGVDGDDLPRFLKWLSLPQTQADLERIRSALARCQGLHDLPADDLKMLGAFTDGAIQDKERLKGISVARIFKWLSAWAPAHVPMIDSEVHNALTGYYPGSWLHESVLLLERFQSIVAGQSELLRQVGQRIAADYAEHFPAPISPVRVLDNLIWFDWLAVYWQDFREHVIPNDEGDCHRVTELGRRFLAEHGF
jgi:hypothetical protein